jgi:hypothetical protein
MDVSEARRLRQLEDENRRLKQMVADQVLDIQALKGVLKKRVVTVLDRKTVVDYLVGELGRSERRACALTSQPRSTQRYDSTRRDDPRLQEGLATWERELGAESLDVERDLAECGDHTSGAL